jgi:hypothetical protein
LYHFYFDIHQKYTYNLEKILRKELYMPKLTLNADSETVSLAKKLAQVNNVSVSEMFSQFIHSLAAGDKTAVELGPLTRKMAGIIKLPRGKSQRDVLTEALIEKYGLKK